METRRITFSLTEYLENLQEVIEDNPDMIDDEVQRYRDFLSRTKEPLLLSVKNFTINHPLVLDNKRLKSFILSCH
jgi:hypothetical protein